MNLVNHIIKSHYNIRKGQLIIGDVPISDIVERFGTPLFIYDPEIFRYKLARLRSALPGFEVHYSVKANPTPSVIKVFLKEGCGLDVATSGELLLALKSGCPPSRIILAGAGKSDRELIEAVKAEVSEIHLESLEEIKLLDEIASHHNCLVNAAIRLNPGDITHNGQVRVKAKAEAFGFDEEDLKIAAEQILLSKNLRLCGLHVYFGTQINDSELLLCMYEHVLKLAIDLAEYAGRSLRTVDFGGGFGVPYYEGEKELLIEDFGKNLKPAMEEARKLKFLRNTRFVIEPGRYLLAEGGLYVTRVMRCKESRGKKFLILDGGIHHHLSATGNLGHVMKRNFPLAIANRIEDRANEHFNLTGRQCTSLDTLARNAKLASADVGDIVVFFQSGAYVRSVSPLGFRSHPAPMELFVEKNVLTTIRREEEDKDLFRGTTLDDSWISGKYKNG